jgi:hypothetical protein
LFQITASNFFVDDFDHFLADSLYLFELNLNLDVENNV